RGKLSVEVGRSLVRNRRHSKHLFLGEDIRREREHRGENPTSTHRYPPSRLCSSWASSVSEKRTERALLVPACCAHRRNQPLNASTAATRPTITAIRVRVRW